MNKWAFKWNLWAFERKKGRNRINQVSLLFNEGHLKSQKFETSRSNENPTEAGNLVESVNSNDEF